MFLGKKKRVLTRIPKGHGRDIFDNFCKNKPALAAAVILLIIVFFSLTADLWFDYNVSALGMNAKNRLAAPSGENWLGTDGFGRDLLAKIVFGSRYSLLFGVGCTGISLVAGAILGAAAAYYGGWIDSAIMRFLDAFMCIPTMLLLLALVAVMGSGLVSLTVAITVCNIPGFTRIVRSIVLSVVNQDFIEAARSCGTKDSAILIRHVIPNAIGPIVVDGMMNVAGIIMTAAGLSYIGMGINPPTPEWGSMLNEASKFMRTAPSVVIFPGIAIVLTALCFNLVGDGLADAIDPRQRD